MPQGVWARKNTLFAIQRCWTWHSTFEDFLSLYPNTCDTAQTIYSGFTAHLAIGLDKLVHPWTSYFFTKCRQMGINELTFYRFSWRSSLLTS